MPFIWFACYFCIGWMVDGDDGGGGGCVEMWILVSVGSDDDNDDVDIAKTKPCRIYFNTTTTATTHQQQTNPIPSHSPSHSTPLHNTISTIKILCTTVAAPIEMSMPPMVFFLLVALSLFRKHRTRYVYCTRRNHRMKLNDESDAKKLSIVPSLSLSLLLCPCHLCFSISFHSFFPFMLVGSCRNRYDSIHNVFVFRFLQLP